MLPGGWSKGGRLAKQWSTDCGQAMTHLCREEGDKGEAFANACGPVADHLAALHLAKIGEVHGQFLLIDAGRKTPCERKNQTHHPLFINHGALRVVA